MYGGMSGAPPVQTACPVIVPVNCGSKSAADSTGAESGSSDGAESSTHPTNNVTDTTQQPVTIEACFHARTRRSFQMPGWLPDTHHSYGGSSLRGPPSGFHVERRASKTRSALQLFSGFRAGGLPHPARPGQEGNPRRSHSYHTGVTSHRRLPFPFRGPFGKEMHATPALSRSTWAFLLPINQAAYSPMLGM